jgi:hypothetical protein
MTKGMVAMMAPNQISQPTSTGLGTYVEGSTGLKPSASATAAALADRVSCVLLLLAAVA